MYLAGLLVAICFQFDPVFDEDFKREIAKVEQPLSIEFLSQAPLSEDSRIHIKAYSGKSCRWCKQSHDLVGEGDDRIVIDWTEEEIPSTVQQKLRHGYQFPVFVCEQASGTLSYPKDWKIYNRDELYGMFSGTEPLKMKTYAATGVGGVIHGKQHIATMFKWLDENVGKDVEIIITWDRTGAQTFPFKAGTDWSPSAFMGRMGYMGIKADGAKNILFSQVSTGYRFLDGTEDLELSPKIVIKNFGKNTFNASGDMPAKFDPITISTIISIGQIIYQILNPKIDLQLPGNIETKIVYRGEQMEVDFVRGPNVHISAWFEFNLAVKKVQLNLEKLHVDFTGSRWITSRDVNIVD